MCNYKHFFHNIMHYYAENVWNFPECACSVFAAAPPNGIGERRQNIVLFVALPVVIAGLHGCCAKQ